VGGEKKNGEKLLREKAQTSQKEGFGTKREGRGEGKGRSALRLPFNGRRKRESFTYLGRGRNRGKTKKKTEKNSEFTKSSWVFEKGSFLIPRKSRIKKKREAAPLPFKTYRKKKVTFIWQKRGKEGGERET